MDTTTSSIVVAVVPMNEDAVPAVVKLHFDAFAGYMNTRIGHAYVRAFIKWFRHAENAISLVAIDSNGKVVGYVVGAPLGYNRSINRDLFWTAVVGIIIRPWLLLSDHFRRRLVGRLRLLLGYSAADNAPPLLPQPTMSLVAIAVSPSAFGRKIGLRLMRAFERRSRDLQMRSLQLSVYMENSAAIRLYKKCGWQPFYVSGKKTTAMHYFRVLCANRTTMTIYDE